MQQIGQISVQPGACGLTDTALVCVGVWLIDCCDVGVMCVDQLI
jgi:hypothetical protein